MIPLPLQSRYHFGQRNRPLPFSDQRYINVTDRYWPLPIDTDRYRILPLLALQALHALKALPIVIKGLLNTYI